MNTFTCFNCNKEITNTKTFTTGYGVDKDNNKFCYPCCAELEKNQMKETGKTVLYLTKENEEYFLTDWGGELRFKVFVSKGRHNIAGVRYDCWFKFNGFYWWGVNYGENSQLTYCKQTKNRY